MNGPADDPGEYSIEIKRDEDVILTWSGYADNPSDALYQAINQRNEEIVRFIREVEER